MLNISRVIGKRDRLSFSGALRHCTVKLYLYCLNYITTFISCELCSIMRFPDIQLGYDCLNLILLFWLLCKGCQHQPVIKQGYTLHFVCVFVHVQEWFLVGLFVCLVACLDFGSHEFMPLSCADFITASSSK